MLTFVVQARDCNPSHVLQALLGRDQGRRRSEVLFGDVLSDHGVADMGDASAAMEWPCPSDPSIKLACVDARRCKLGRPGGCASRWWRPRHTVDDSTRASAPALKWASGRTLAVVITPDQLESCCVELGHAERMVLDGASMFEVGAFRARQCVVGPFEHTIGGGMHTFERVTGATAQQAAPSQSPTIDDGELVDREPEEPRATGWLSWNW